MACRNGRIHFHYFAVYSFTVYKYPAAAVVTIAMRVRLEDSAMQARLIAFVHIYV